MKNRPHFQIYSVLLWAIFSVSCSEQAETQSTESALSVSNNQTVEQDASEFTVSNLLDLENHTVIDVELQGKNILLNYWATWCGPCIREIPSLINAQSELGDDFLVLMASDESIEDIQLFIEENDFQGGNFVKLDGYFADYEIQAIPSTSLFNTKGQQLGNWLGAFEWDSPEIVAELQGLVQK